MIHQQIKVRRKQTPLHYGIKSYSNEHRITDKLLKLATDINSNKNNNSTIRLKKYIFQDNHNNQGSFGKIMIAKSNLDGQVFAVKKVLQDPKYQNRELQILKNLDHQCIAPLRDYYFQLENNRKYLFLIMDLYDLSLKDYPQIPIKSIAKQLFSGLLYLQSLSIMHRDLKPSNILVKDGNIFICDFGSAKTIDGSQSLTYICSRPYRAPELLFGNEYYDYKVDMWSVGCILVELLNQQIFFPGESTVDQVVEICKILGTPSEEDKKEIGVNFNIPQIKGIPLFKVINTENKLLLDLLGQILVFNPRKRISAGQALCHQYFIE